MELLLLHSYTEFVNSQQSGRISLLVDLNSYLRSRKKFRFDANQFFARAHTYLHIRDKIFSSTTITRYASSSLLMSMREIGSYEKKFTYNIKNRRPFFLISYRL